MVIDHRAHIIIPRKTPYMHTYTTFIATGLLHCNTSVFCNHFDPVAGNRVLQVTTSGPPAPSPLPASQLHSQRGLESRPRIKGGEVERPPLHPLPASQSFPRRAGYQSSHFADREMDDSPCNQQRVRSAFRVATSRKSFRDQM